MANFFDVHESNSVQLSLGDFEGPIDLLYTLIVEQGKYDIDSFPLSQITGQYMQYMKSVNELDIDVASDFVGVATTLLEIKSKNVLPKQQYEIEDDDYQEDPEDVLRQRIAMYGLLKRQGEILKEREQCNKFYRKPLFTDADAIFVLKDFKIEDVIDCYGRMMIRFSDQEEKTTIKKIQKDKYTVQDKITFLSQYILENKRCFFNSLCGEKVSRSEKISTFQALLELMKKQLVCVFQESFNSDILIEINEDLEQNTQVFDNLILNEGDYNE